MAEKVTGSQYGHRSEANGAGPHIIQDAEVSRIIATNQTQPKTHNGNMRERFVREYLVDRNGTQAAIRAGYSPKTAAAQASRLLRDVKVQQAVQQREAKILGELEGRYAITKGVRQLPTGPASSCAPPYSEDR